MRTILLAAFACLFFTSTPTQAQVGQDHFRAWERHDGGQRVMTKRTKKGRTVQARFSPAVARHPVVEAVNAVSRILPHPSGCPRRAFCGCGAAVEVFGRPVRSLWLAANWLKFPPAQPASGMVAARRGHVMVIRQYLGNNRALVYDANSGRGLTRLHVRSLSGFSIRNPRA
jgi:hypothetical protein